MARLADNAKALRKGQTDAEKLLWRHLRNRQLMGFRFRRQEVIDPYIVNFICFEAQVIVEVDGGQHSERIIYDEKRTAFLVSQGFTVVRFWNNEILQNLENALETLTLTLSRKREREQKTEA